MSAARGGAALPKANTVGDGATAAGHSANPRLGPPPVGHGSVALDGSPVDFYANLPPGRGPEIVHATLPPGCTVLELGCGVGRMTHRLIELGHPVVAVDPWPEMLAHVRSADAILADIESLDLGRTFRGVVLASYLVNVVDRARRRAFLRTCARHVSEDGSVLIERADPAWHTKPGTVSSGVVGRARIRTRTLERTGSLVRALAEYTVGGSTWIQEYRSQILDDRATIEALDEAGLALRRWLDRPTWLEAAKQGGPP